jgi:DNA-binding MarR family transcriptional regulator
MNTQEDHVTLSSGEVGQAYLELHHLVHRRVDHAMSSAGLSFARVKVLMKLDQRGPMNQATLAGLLGFAPRSVTETVDALERDGLVTRAEDENDRRARIITLTPAGREAHAAAMVVRSKIMDEVFGTLTPPERTTLVALLNAIRSNLCQETPCDQ